jgi:thiamine kinase-like enzyme
VPECSAMDLRAGEFDPSDLALFQRSSQRTALALRDPIGPVQALHGDAHKSNLLKTARGLLWTDFEDTCSGPVAWDTACFSRAAPESVQAALANYELAPSFEEQKPYLEARNLQGVLWSAVVASRFHQDRFKARQGLQSWKEQASILVPGAQGRNRSNG